MQGQLATCFKAIQCVEPTKTCVLSQTTCLNLNGIDILPLETRKSLSECKVESLLCMLRMRTELGMAECEKMYHDCSQNIGVFINGNLIVNYAKDIPLNEKENPITKTSNTPGTTDLQEGKTNLDVTKNYATTPIPNNKVDLVVRNILENITQNLYNELGTDVDIEIISGNDDSNRDKIVLDDNTLSIFLVGILREDAKVNKEDSLINEPIFFLLKGNKTSKEKIIIDNGKTSNIGEEIINIIRDTFNATKMDLSTESYQNNVFRMDLPIWYINFIEA